ncbi:MAG: T9SS type A sorting domain-containing protein [Cytophagales bacterium]|nr:T9SS type A sorting domain-containing protein [Cytophagales bacterium]
MRWFWFLWIILLPLGVSAQEEDSRVIRYLRVGGSGDGSSWERASGNLARLLTTARSNWDIYASVGKYVFTSTDRDQTYFFPEGVRLYGGFPKTGDPGLEDRYISSDRDERKTILSGDIGAPVGALNDLVTDSGSLQGDRGFVDNVRHVVTVLGDGVHIEGLTIEAGYAEGAYNTAGGQGAGIYIPYAGTNGPIEPSFERLELRYNHAGAGAAIYANENAVFTEVNVHDNVSLGNLSKFPDGVEGVVWLGKESVFNRGRIYKNLSNIVNENSRGAGIFVQGLSDGEGPIVANTLVYQNHAGRGGGAYVRGKGHIVNCTFFRNRATHYQEINPADSDTSPEDSDPTGSNLLGGGNNLLDDGDGLNFDSSDSRDAIVDDGGDGVDIDDLLGDGEEEDEDNELLLGAGGGQQGDTRPEPTREVETEEETQVFPQGGGLVLEVLGRDAGQVINTLAISNFTGTSDHLDDIHYLSQRADVRFVISNTLISASGITIPPSPGYRKAEISRILGGISSSSCFRSEDDRSPDYLKIKPDSPSVNSGDNKMLEDVLESVEALRGGVRIQGGQVDVGSYETDIIPTVREYDSFLPESAPVGEIINIFGRGFSSFGDYNVVFFEKDLRVSKIDRSVIGTGKSTHIRVKVPEGAQTGRLRIFINEGNSDSATTLKAFRVTEGAPEPIEPNTPEPKEPVQRPVQEPIVKKTDETILSLISDRRPTLIPNPSPFETRLEGEGIYLVQVYDISGHLVLEKEVFLGKDVLPPLPYGLYFLKLSPIQSPHATGHTLRLLSTYTGY